MRTVITFAREVRIRLRNAGVIFATVIAPASTNDESYVVRPWGVTWTTTYFYANVARVAPVRRMKWETQRAICAMQSVAFSAKTG